MNRTGSTTLFVLIISAVCLPILAFAWQTLFIQAKLNSNRVDMIQGELNLETEINRLVYNEAGINDKIIEIIKLYPDKFDNMEHNIPIASTLLENTSGKLSFENNKDDRPKYKLNISATYKGMDVSKNITGNIFNREIDDCDNGLVYSQNSSEEHINKVEELLTIIPDSIDTDFLPSAHSLVRTSNNNEIRILAKPFGPSRLYLDNSNCNYVNIINNRVVLIVEKDGFNRNNVLIDCSGYSSVMLSGIIYIENGDLSFKGKCNFQGIILIKDGEIKREAEEISTITGKVVLNSFKDPREAVEINYGAGNYLKYAKYLSPLVDPEIVKIEIE
ncbi:MAG: hypothetical protein RBR71_00700 [Gudongella sp.]|nr:hypothetical protein [Gudongella sp.]